MSTAVNTSALNVESVLVPRGETVWMYCL